LTLRGEEEGINVRYPTSPRSFSRPATLALPTLARSCRRWYQSRWVESSNKEAYDEGDEVDEKEHRRDKKVDFANEAALSCRVGGCTTRSRGIVEVYFLRLLEDVGCVRHGVGWDEAEWGRAGEEEQTRPTGNAVPLNDLWSATEAWAVLRRD
jgi:hypothetical protein